MTVTEGVRETMKQIYVRDTVGCYSDFINNFLGISGWGSSLGNREWCPRYVDSKSLYIRNKLYYQHSQYAFQGQLNWIQRADSWGNFSGKFFSSWGIGDETPNSLRDQCNAEWMYQD